MGLGIWSMHYLGMLAFRLPVPVLYDLPTVVLSLLAAVFASGVALFVVSRRTFDVPGALGGSLVMGGGIATMHYLGMDAMRLPAMCLWNLALVALSVAIAVLLPVSLSLGVVASPGQTLEASHLIEAADQALYRAKALGRNRVALAGESRPLPELWCDGVLAARSDVERREPWGPAAPMGRVSGNAADPARELATGHTANH